MVRVTLTTLALAAGLVVNSPGVGRPVDDPPKPVGAGDRVDKDTTGKKESGTTAAGSNRLPVR